MSNIGRPLYGYCHGYFGDTYRDKRIEAEGFDWIVARDDMGEVYFTEFETESEKKGRIAQWGSEHEDYY